MTTYAVIGSRSFSNYKLLSETLSALPVTKIVSGGAPGADSLGAQYAKENNIPLVEYLPEWDKYGKGAAYRRNITIIDNSEEVVAFWDGISPGTKHSLLYANNLKRPIFIIGNDLDEN